MKNFRKTEGKRYSPVGFGSTSIRIGNESYRIHPVYLLTLLTLIHEESPNGMIADKGKLRELKSAARLLTVPAVYVKSLPKARHRPLRQVPCFKVLLEIANAYIHAKKKLLKRRLQETGLDRLDNPFEAILSWALLMTYCHVLLGGVSYQILDLGLSSRRWRAIEERFFEKLPPGLTRKEKISALSDMAFRTVTENGFSCELRPGAKEVLAHLRHGAKMCLHCEDDLRIRFSEADCLKLQQRGHLAKFLKERWENSSAISREDSSLASDHRKVSRTESELLVEEVRLARQARDRFAMNARESSGYTADELFESPFVDCLQSPCDHSTVMMTEFRCPDGHFRFWIDRGQFEEFLRWSMDKKSKPKFDVWCAKHFPKGVLAENQNDALCGKPLAADIFRRR